MPKITKTDERLDLTMIEDSKEKVEEVVEDSASNRELGYRNVYFG